MAGGELFVARSTGGLLALALLAQLLKRESKGWAKGQPRRRRGSKGRKFGRVGNPKGYSQAVSHACIIHVCHTGYETATTLWHSPTAPDKLSAALITKAQP